MPKRKYQERDTIADLRATFKHLHQHDLLATIISMPRRNLIADLRATFKHRKQHDYLATIIHEFATMPPILDKISTGGSRKTTLTGSGSPPSAKQRRG